MHLHILGICGTFMGGLAQLAQTAGHRVSGCDANVYPPMSDQLAASGIELVEGFSADQLRFDPDIWVIGNVVTRGNPLMEAILEGDLAYCSGPHWLAEHVLRRRHVLAVAGTHGKTTTTAMLASILDRAGLAPGFLIGGVPADFGTSARLSDSRFFVIEADEYDTAFFDKRSKFIHYRPRTLVLNNLEFDHADIFPDVAAIETQFHHLIRTLPASGRILAKEGEPALDRVLARGCWSELQRFGSTGEWAVGSDAPWPVRVQDRVVGDLVLDLPGEHNRFNALAAIAAANHVGVAAEVSVSALAGFKGVKRRLEVRGVVDEVTVIDDFAHHPTAIAATLDAVRARHPGAPLVAVLEPRSNTMKLGAVAANLPRSLEKADRVFCYAGPSVSWNVEGALAPLGGKASVHRDFDALLDAIIEASDRGTQLVVMSNGGFNAIHQKLLTRLKERTQVAT